MYEESAVLEPGLELWKSAKRLVRYLKATCGEVLDYASVESDRKSTSGLLFKAFGNIVSWTPKKQPVDSDGSTIQNQIIFPYQKLYKKVNETGAVSIFEDNQSTL